MKMAAVRAIADLAVAGTPDEVRSAYGGQHLRFGRDYLIPKPFDLRLMECVAPAVARAAASRWPTAKRPIKGNTIMMGRRGETAMGSAQDKRMIVGLDIGTSKVVAIVGMIILGCYMLFSGSGGSQASVSNLWSHGGFFPNGGTGLLMAMAFIMFSFGGETRERRD